MESVYLETTIPSYLAAHPSSLPDIARDQQATHRWWNTERQRFDLFTSVFTLDEVGRGDAGAAARRLVFLQGVPDLKLPAGFAALETDLIGLFKLPARAATDASHVALCILHHMDYLLTWNCTHLANATLQKELVTYCNHHELHVPIICTPATLIQPEI